MIHSSAGSIVIQRAEAGLIPSFYKALDRVAKERIYIEMIEAPPLEKVIGFQTKALERGFPVSYAVHGDDVVGWCDIFPSDNPRLAHRGSLGMGVLKDFRGQGLGSKLLAHAIEQAKSGDLEKIELHVYTHNVGAIALYKKHGFEQEGLIRRYRKIDGEYFDCVAMGLFL